MTVKRLLTALNLQHCLVSIRKRDKRYGMTYIGGGMPAHVISRYGAYIVMDSMISDGILVLFVD